MFWTFITCIVIYFLIDWLIRLPKVGDYVWKHVFITGCDSGFGRDLAIRLDKMGFPVFAGCLTSIGAEQLAEACSSRLVTMLVDVTDDASIQNAFETVRKSLPSEKDLWAVVNNAGVPGTVVPLELSDRKGYINTCNVNLFGPIEVSRVFMPLLRKSQGRLVNITSIMGRYPGANFSYTISKFGLEAFCDVIRREVYRFGVKVSAIEPGFFRTNIIDPERCKREAKVSWDAASAEVKAAYGPYYVERFSAVIYDAAAVHSPHIHKVVNAYVEAITSKYPRPRYVVGNDAKFLILLSFLPEWLADFLSRVADQTVVGRLTTV